VTKSLVIVPTYNEKENVGKIIQMILSLPENFSVVVVDDQSPDGTAQIVRDNMPEYPERLFLLERKGKLGLGTAYIHGFHWGLNQGFDYLFEMDADFSHNPSNLPDLLYELSENGSDVVIGSRYVKGGRVENWPWDRKLLSYGASLYVRIITCMPVKDPTAGFVGYRREVLESIDLNRIRFIGYAFQIEMKFSAYRLGFNLTEIPITFVDRVAGISKLSSNIINEAVMGVLAMRFKNWSKKDVTPRPR